MGLGRITRFAPTPPGSRRVNVMRAGRAGVKALAPPDDLFADFSREKSEAKRAGASAEAAHAAAFRRTRYRARFRRQILSSADSREALRALLEEAKARDVYLMCMCPYRTPDEACHTYLLLALAREMDPAVRILPEPRPAKPAGPGRPAARRGRGRVQRSPRHEHDPRLNPGSRGRPDGDTPLRGRHGAGDPR